MDALALLPHQPPMRLLDEVLELQPGKLALARRVTHLTDFYFQGHFPGDPIVPAVILVEMLAQAGGLAAGAPRGGRAAGADRAASGRTRPVQVPGGGPRGRRPRRAAPASSGSSAISTRSKGK